MTILIISKAIEEGVPRSWHRMWVNGKKKEDFCKYDGDDAQIIALTEHRFLEKYGLILYYNEFGYPGI